MGAGDAAIVALEERHEVLRQILFVADGEGSHDAEIDTGIAPVAQHENIAGVHVGMKKCVAEHLRKKYFHAVAGQAFDVDVMFFQLLDVVDGNGVDALHHQHFFAAIIPKYFRHVKQAAVGEITLELTAIRCFANHIEFVDNGFFELAHDFARTQAPTIGQKFFHQDCEHVQQRNILPDCAFDGWPHDLDRRLTAGFFASGDDGEMDLGDGRAGDRREIKVAKDLSVRLAIGGVERSDDFVLGKRRDAILQLGKLGDDIGRDEIGPHRKQLAEFDEDRAKPLQCEPQAFGAGTRERAPEQQRAEQRT